MGSAFHQLCPGYSGTLTLTGSMSVRLWETLNFLSILLNGLPPFLKNTGIKVKRRREPVEVHHTSGKHKLILSTFFGKYF